MDEIEKDKRELRMYVYFIIIIVGFCLGIEYLRSMIFHVPFWQLLFGAKVIAVSGVK